MTMQNLFPATATDSVAVASSSSSSSSSSSKRNDNDDQVKNSIKDHFNDTKTVRRRGSRTRKQVIATPVEPTIDERFADDSTAAVEDGSTFAPSAAGIVATDDEITQNLMATTNDKKFDTTEKTVQENNTAAPAPHIPPCVQTAMLPPSILRQQPHFGTVSPPLPPGTMAYNNNISMMPPLHPAYSYYNCYDYSCNSASSTRGGGHPSIKNVEVQSSSGSNSLGGGTGAGGCDYSYYSGIDSSSYCTTPSLLLTEPCEGFAKLVLLTVDIFASSVVRVMDYGEKLCDSSSGNNNNINTNNSSSSIGTGGSRSTMSNEYVDLLAKIERLQKMVTEKETVFVATEKEEDGVAPSTPNGSSNIINDLTESPITKEAEENENTKTMNKLHSTLLDYQPAVDSMGFPLDDEFSSPLPKSSDNALLSWGCDFSSSSSDPFKCLNSVGSCDSSPVSVATTLESHSCANCGLDGKNVYKSMKKNLIICAQCKSTHNCSSECQSEDWSNGHFKTCQPPAAAAVNEVLL